MNQVFFFLFFFSFSPFMQFNVNEKKNEKAANYCQQYCEEKPVMFANNIKSF